MAIMYPSSIDDYNATESEKKFFNILKEFLPDSYRVFYSIRWFSEKDGIRKDSECDFLILDPTLGYISVEVKGGLGIEKDGDQWKLILEDNEYRKLDRSPYLQAEESMRYFKEYYEEQYGFFYKGVYGFAVAFPNYNINHNLGIGTPKILTLDYRDMSNLEHRIREIFNYWKGANHNFIAFSKDQQKKFVNLIHKRVSLSAAAGALIEYRHKQLNQINRVQDNYIYFLSNFNQVYITGGAGTGKTWIGIKKAKLDAENGKRVLFLCSSFHLMKWVKAYFLETPNADCLTFKELIMRNIRPEDYDKIKGHKELTGVENYIEKAKNLKKYDSIIVDEGQDFTAEWAYCTRFFLEDQVESDLYVFFDEYQNIFNRDFENRFDIKIPPFTLIENLRNTSNIYNFATEETGLGRDVIPNTIEGAYPESIGLKNRQSARNKLESIMNTLIHKEGVSNKNITVLSDLPIGESILLGHNTLGNWEFNQHGDPVMSNEIRFRTIDEFKGLESDVIIYLNHKEKTEEKLYVAYTRARFYLYEIKLKNK